MSGKLAIMAGLAVVFGATSYYAGNQYLESQAKARLNEIESSQVSIEVTQVVVATDELRFGDTLAADKLPAMLAATVFLAVAANFYELLCTAGFPMVYTRILTLGEPSAAMRYFYLALYNLVYVLPLAAIVLVFVRTLGARKLGEREGRLLKLLSGTMMLELGVLLLVAPEWLSRLGVAFALLAGAVAVTWLAARLTR